MMPKLIGYTPIRFLSAIIICALCLFAFPSISGASTPKYRIDIKGVSEVLLTNINARIEIETKILEDNPSEGEIKAFFRMMPELIKKSMEPYGYFKATVQSSIKRTNSIWVATFIIHPGPVIMINQVDVSVSGAGKHNTAIQGFIKQFPLKANRGFSALAYEEAKTAFLQVANNQGYIHADFQEKEIRINLNAYTASIRLHLVTGEQFYFGNVTFDQPPFSHQFMQRLIPFSSNEPFSPEKLLTLQRALEKSTYFQQATFTPDYDHPIDRHIPIRLAVITPKAKKYNFGVGYGTLTGPRFTASTEFRRLNDAGHYFTAQLKLSQVLSGVAAKYFIPGSNPLTDLYTIGANYQKFNPENGTSHSQSLLAGYSKKIENWKYSIVANYLNESYKVEEQPSERSNLIYPTFNIIYVKADDLVNPTEGKSVNVTLQGTHKDLFSATSFLQGAISGKYIFSPTKMSRLIFRGDLGYTVTDDLNKIPLSLRFFAGGINTIRGYKDSSIGPGRYLQIASAEYQHHVTGDWSGSVFYDMGNAANHFSEGYKKSTGVGIIYSSVIGPIKVYISHPLDGSHHPYSIDLNIGPEFS